MRKRVSIRYFYLGLLFILIATSRQSFADSIRIGIVDSALTGTIKQGEKLNSFQGELAHLICQRSGLECVFILQPFAKNISDLRSGNIEIAFSSILVKEDRKQFMLFSGHYMRSFSAFVGNPKRQPQAGPVSVAVLKGSVHERYLMQRSGGLTIIPKDRLSDIIQSLLDDEVHRALLPSNALRKFLSIKENSAFELLGDPLESPELGGFVAAGIRPDRPDLKTKVDEALISILIDGSFKKLNEKYYPFNVY